MTIVEIIEDYFSMKYGAAETVERLKNTNASQSFISPAIRVVNAFENHKFFDCVGHIRQMLEYCHCGIHLRGMIYEKCKEYSKIFSLYVNDNIVDSYSNVLTDIPEISFKYDFVLRRKQNEVIGDATLYNIFGFKSYLSFQQKMMIHNLKIMEKGNVYLACLSTGSGKSLLWQYAVADRIFKGVTIVVVPTNALATDHIKGDKEVFKNMPWVKSITYSSAENLRNETYLDSLCKVIDSGEDTILYISPEGLVNSKIKKAILRAAERGNIGAVVVDEVHLLIDWGAHFRPEFQLIPSLCKKLNSYEKKIYTVLLSATVTDNDKAVLEGLFSYGNFIEYRGEALRPELEYYTKCYKYKTQREEELKRLVPLCPKPMIIYVATKEQCSTYLEIVRSIGFKNCEMFTGETGDTEREVLITRWRKNDIDIMVATSAFGMGVDKADVRTIISAYIPENISRFYQEVGRAGRDGYSALSFSLVCFSEDESNADRFTNSKILTAESLLERWKEMKDNHEPDEDASCIWVRTSDAPEHLHFSKTGGKNSGWNQDVLLFLARNGYIEIEDIVREPEKKYKSYKIKMHLLKVHELEDGAKLLKEVEKYREDERKNITEGKDAVKNMFLNESCYSVYFFNTFKHAGVGCNGCPVCRQNGWNTGFSDPSMTNDLIFSVSEKNNYSYRNSLSNFGGMQSIGMLYYDETIEQDKVRDLISRLILTGTDYIVTVDDKQYVEELCLIERNDYLIVNHSELDMILGNIKNGTIAIFFIEDDSANQDLLNNINRHKNDNDEMNVIIICKRDTYWKKQQHYLKELVEYAIPLESVLKEEIVC